MARNSDHWIQKAHIKKGTFTAYCNKQGFKGVTMDCIKHAQEHGSTTTQRRANLAATFKRMHGGNT